MSCTTESKTRECTVRIVDAVGILYKEERRVTTFLECLRPDSVVVISVVICTGKGNIEKSTTSELSVEIDSVPLEVEIETECEFRTVRTAEISAVVSRNLTVTINIDILYITDVRTCTIPC